MEWKVKVNYLLRNSYEYLLEDVEITGLPFIGEWVVIDGRQYEVSIIERVYNTIYLSIEVINIILVDREY